VEAGGLQVPGHLSQKENMNKRAKVVIQVIVHLTSMCKALGSIPSTRKKENKQMPLISG
jgi:hypothetical protein